MTLLHQKLFGVRSALDVFIRYVLVVFLMMWTLIGLKLIALICNTCPSKIKCLSGDECLPKHRIFEPSFPNSCFLPKHHLIIIELQDCLGLCGNQNVQP